MKHMIQCLLKVATEKHLRFQKIALRHQMLQFYMGKNTPGRQKFIIENLKIELDVVEE